MHTTPHHLRNMDKNLVPFTFTCFAVNSRVDIGEKANQSRTLDWRILAVYCEINTKYLNSNQVITDCS